GTDQKFTSLPVKTRPLRHSSMAKIRSMQYAGIERIASVYPERRVVHLNRNTNKIYAQASD
ncbi:MAG: hypothetical protein KKE53_10770, partial [Proteobacteria bacterium]|nr:hypothetical protein [Pseudomonadota bacterium]